MGEAIINHLSEVGINRKNKRLAQSRICTHNLTAVCIRETLHLNIVRNVTLFKQESTLYSDDIEMKSCKMLAGKTQEIKAVHMNSYTTSECASCLCRASPAWVKHKHNFIEFQIIHYHARLNLSFHSFRWWSIVHLLIPLKNMSKTDKLIIKFVPSKKCNLWQYRALEDPA